MRRAVLFGLTIVAVAIGSYLFALYSYPRGLWPVNVLRGLGDGVRSPGARDDHGRLIAYPGKISVSCPQQTDQTAVLLAIGQSNVANHAARRVITRHGQAVVNYFDGKCYIAASPLLGATGDGGEFLTLLADRLVDDGLYRNVIVVSVAVGGTPISRWARHGDLNAMLAATLRQLSSDYRVTQVIWHHGEADVANRTTTEAYAAAFASLLETLAEDGVNAPVYTTVSTRCNAEWTATNPISAAQRKLEDGRRVFLATDVDALLGPEDRHDGCHMSESGQRKVAAAFAAAIKRSRK